MSKIEKQSRLINAAVGLILLAPLLLVSSAQVWAQSPLDKSKSPAPIMAADADADVIPNRYIVVFKEELFPRGATAAGETPRQVAERLMEAYQGELHFVYEEGLLGFAATLFPASVSGVQAEPEVAYIEQDQTTPPIPVPSLPEIGAADQQFGAIWGLDRIDQRDLPLDSNYDYNVSGAGVHVYIIDTGIRATHSEFSSRVGAGYDFVDGDSNPDDCNGHGTHVAGTVGGTVYGVAKDAALHAVRVLDCSGSGSYSAVIAGINWVKDNHISPAVINMSLGGGFSQSVNDAVAAAHDAGVTVVVAAGNSSTDACSSSPAAAPKAITVGATDSSDNRSYFSNYGTCLDIFGPGSSIKSAWIGGDNTFNTISGTSMASPHVAGVAALYLEANPSAPPHTVVTDLTGMASADKLSSVGTGSPNLLLYTGDISTTPLRATPTSQTVCRGNNAIYAVNVEAGAGFPVSLSVNGTPSGASAIFGVNPVESAGSTNLTLGSTNQAETGSYSIDIIGTGTTSTVSRTVQLTLLDVPSTALPIWPGSDETDVKLIPTFLWSAVSGASNYYFELATSPSFATPMYTATVESTGYTVPDRLDPTTTYYWRVSAANQCGASSASSAIAFTTGLSPTVLLVDDDDDYPDVQAYYAAALDALGVTYDVYDAAMNDSADPSLNTLTAYQTILWFTGGNYYSDTGPNATGEAALGNYLSGSTDRCLFISSQDYLWAQGVDSDTPNTFMQLFLGASAASSDHDDAVATAANDLSHLGSYTLDFPFTNYVDWITPDSTAATVFTGDSTNSIAVSKITAGYRTMWWGFPLEALPTATDRQTALDEVLTWCASPSNNDPTDISLSNDSLAENQPAGTTIGAFSTTDVDADDTHTYSLVAGQGDGHNSSFSIDDSMLKTTTSFNFEEKSSLNIRVQTDDGNGGIFAKAMTVTVENVNETPVVTDDTAVTLVNTPVSIHPLENDRDPDGAKLVFTGVTQPDSGGVVAVASEVSLSFTPADNFDGQVSFTYAISDGMYSESAVVTVSVVKGDVLIVTDPATETELVFSGHNVESTVHIPAGAAEEVISLVYEELYDSDHALPDDALSVGRTFTLDAYPGGELVEAYRFKKPIIITLTYEAGLLDYADPVVLRLRYWNEAEQRWRSDGISLVSHVADARQITYRLDHLTEFALMVVEDTSSQVYLPLILR